MSNICNLKQNDACTLGMAMRMLASIKGIAVIIHGPEECSNAYGNIYSNSHMSQNSIPIIVSTNLNDDDLIFGGVDKLEEAFEYVVNLNQTKDIFILNTCATAIIGDDNDFIIKRIRDKYKNYNIAFINSEGIRYNHFYDIYKEIAKALFNSSKFTDDFSEITDKIAIINTSSSGLLDMKEIYKLLLPLKIEPLFIPYFSNIDIIKKIPRVKYNTYLCKSVGKYFCNELLENYFQTTIEAPAPIGIKNTNKWLRKIGEKFRKKETVENLISFFNKRIDSDLKEIREKLKGKRVLITAGPGKIVSLVNLCSELELNVVIIGDMYSDEIENEIKCNLDSCNIYHDIQWNEITDLIEAEKIDFYLGQHGFFKEVNKKGIPFIEVSNFNEALFGYDSVVRIGKKMIYLYDNSSTSIYRKIQKFKEVNFE